MRNFSIESLINTLDTNATTINSKNKLIFGTNSGIVLGKVLYKNNKDFEFENFATIKILFENVPEDKFIFTENAKSFIVLYDVVVINNNSNITLPFLILFLPEIQYLSFGQLPKHLISGIVLGKVLYKNNKDFEFENFATIKILFENVPEDKFIFTENAKSFIVLYDVVVINNNSNITLTFLILFLPEIQYLSFGQLPKHLISIDELWFIRFIIS